MLSRDLLRLDLEIGNKWENIFPKLFPNRKGDPTDKARKKEVSET